jgi:hypothetical protein
MNFEIRPLTATDRNAWEPLWRGYLEFYEAKLAPEVTETTWSRLMRDGEDPNGLCAVDGRGRLVGMSRSMLKS